MSYTYEMNSARKDADIQNIRATSPIVEVFSAAIKGSDLSKFGKVADKSIEYIKALGVRAEANDSMAIAEMNSIRKYAIEPELLAELKLLSFFGTYENLGYGESIEVDADSYIGEKSRAQALNGDVVFPAIATETYSVPTYSVSGGFVVDYRKVAMGDMAKENELMNQVKIDIRNKALKYVIDTVYAKVKGATGAKFTAETSGIVKANLDAIITGIKRMGKPVIMGDYAVVSQINAFLGWSDGASTPFKGISQTAMDEIRKTGLISFYNGCPVVEIPNGFDYTQPTSNTFKTIFPQNLLFVIPTGTIESPIKTWTRGGLTTFSGNDVTTGKIATRFDLEVACDVAKGKEFKIGIEKDTTSALA